MKSENTLSFSSPDNRTARGKEAGLTDQPGITTTFDCIPCLIRQTLGSVRLSLEDPVQQERAIREVLKSMAFMEMRSPPPILARQIHRRIREITGKEDPYREAKARFNRMALEMLPELASRVAASPDPFFLAVRLAIAGNVIDLGAKTNLGGTEARASVTGCLEEPFHGDIDQFRQAADRAVRILYLADNAGEIVFDRLLIERLGPARVTVAVRGSAVINDATMRDALEAGVADLTEVIDNGFDAPGTVLRQCSEEFRRRFCEADMIISKGQGNLETLAGIPAPIFFLFKVKCQVIASHTGLPVGTHVLAGPPDARMRPMGKSPVTACS